MENSQKHNQSLGVNQIGKNKRKIYFQQTIDDGNNIIRSGRYIYPHSDYYEVHKDEFKSFIQHITGDTSNALRPLVPDQVSAPVPPSQALYNALPAHPEEPITGNPLVDNSQINLVEFPISASMRNSQDLLPQNIGNSEGNQFQPYPHQSQVFDNINVQHHPIITSQEQFYPINGSNQFVNGFHSSQTNANNQLPHGFPSTQTNVANPSLSLNDTNQTFNVNNINQLTRLQKIRPPTLSIVRPPIPAMASMPVPPFQAPYNTLLRNHVQSANCPPIVDNSENNLVESPVSAFMRNFQDPTMNFGDSRDNQFHLYPSHPQVFNNTNAQYQPIIQSQEYYYPLNGNNNVVNGFPSTQTNVFNPSMSLNATNPTFPTNGSNQHVIGSSSSQKNDPLSPTSEFILPSPKNDMNFLSPQSPYRPPLSPSLFSSPPSPEYPLFSHLVPDPPSPLSSSLFPSTTSPKRQGYQ